MGSSSHTHNRPQSDGEPFLILYFMFGTILIIDNPFTKTNTFSHDTRNVTVKNLVLTSKTRYSSDEDKESKERREGSKWFPIPYFLLVGIVILEY